MEFLMARLSTQINRAIGGEAKIDNFIRFHDEKVGGIEDIVKLMAGKQGQ